MNKQNTAFDIPQQKLINLIKKSSKILPLNNSLPYEELGLFRRQLDATSLGASHHAFRKFQNNAAFYRTIFAAFGFTFLILTAFIYFRTGSCWVCPLFFAPFALAKTTLSTFCGSLSLSAFVIAYKIRAEKEAVNHFFKQARRKLDLLYARKCTELGISRFFAFCQQHQKTKALKQHYHELLDKMDELRDGAISLLSSIAKAKVGNEERRTLFNQAILEMKENINQIVRFFEGSHG